MAGDSYVWDGGVAGSWNLASNWDDLTLGQPALVAPGVNDAVTVDAAGGGAATVISGVGASASLTLNGDTVLAGQFTTGAFSLGANDTLTLGAGDTLSVGGAATLTAAAQGTQPVAMTVSGIGSLLSVGGALTIGSRNYVTISNQATLDAGSIHGTSGSYAYFNDSTVVVSGILDASAGAFFFQNNATAQVGALTIGSSIFVNSGASLEVGSAGGAAADSLTIDAGVSVALNGGGINADNVVLNGSLIVSGGANVAANGVTGAGSIDLLSGSSLGLTGLSVGSQVQIQIGADAALSLTAMALGGTSAVGVDFTGPGGSLTIDATSLDVSKVFDPTIAGFTSSDTLDYTGAATGASYADGILTLVNGAATVAQFTLAGDYSGQVFLATPLTNGTTQISLASVTVPGPQNAQIGGITSISGVDLSDGTAAGNGSTITVNLTDSLGLLFATSGTKMASTMAHITGAGTKDLTIVGTVSQVNAALATLSYEATKAGIDQIVLTGAGGIVTQSDPHILVATPQSGLTMVSLTTGKDRVTTPGISIIAATKTLSKGDAIAPGGGWNTLTLTGGGNFDLRAPTTLTNVEELRATEGSGTAMATVYLRNGLNVYVQVAAGTGTTAGIKIFGANDSSVIQLASGTDTVTLGAATETVFGGGGTDRFNVTAATIGATINGGSGQSSLFVSGGGVVSMGPNITNVETVTMSTATTFTANNLNLTITGSNFADTIRAGSGTDVITGGGGADQLFAGSGADTFRDTAPNLSLDTINGFLAGDAVDITNLKYSSKTKVAWANGILTVTAGAAHVQIKLTGNFTGTFSALSDGASGTKIIYAPPSTASFAQAISCFGSSTDGAEAKFTIGSNASPHQRMLYAGDSSRIATDNLHHQQM